MFPGTMITTAVLGNTITTALFLESELALLFYFQWYAILLDIVGGYEGTKKRIENAYVVKEHFQKANELNPEDATSLHTLGFW